MAGPADTLCINGRFTTTDERVIGAEDRGFQFGDGLYEVIKFLSGKPLFAKDHFDRLSDGLNELEITNPWSEGTFDDLCGEVLRRTTFGDGIIYFQVTRGESERVHFYREDVPPTSVVYTRRFKFPDGRKKERGINAVTVADERWKRCNIKSTNLLGNALAKKRAQRAGGEEALLVADGQVREGASSSFFAVVKGQLITYPTGPEILPGIVRHHVISLALAEKIRVDERPLREDRLYSLDEAFITSTTQGVMPVTEIDSRVIGNSRRGEITERLQQLYDEAESRESEKALARS